MIRYASIDGSRYYYIVKQYFIISLRISDNSLMLIRYSKISDNLINSISVKEYYE